MDEDDDGFCPSCKKHMSEKEAVAGINYAMDWRYLYKNPITGKTQGHAFLPNEFPGVAICLPCAKRFTPWASKFADIYAVIALNNHLLKVIKERENGRT